MQMTGIGLQEVVDELEAVLIFQRMKRQNASNCQIVKALNEFEAKIDSKKVWAQMKISKDEARVILDSFRSDADKNLAKNLMWSIEQYEKERKLENENDAEG